MLSNIINKKKWLHAVTLHEFLFELSRVSSTSEKLVLIFYYSNEKKNP